jgi:hypothetical protein
MAGNVTVAQAIRELRAQLIEAADEGQSSDIRFVPRSVEVELDIKFELESQGSAGFKVLSLVDLSGKAKLGRESSHKIKLTLDPVNKDGKPAVIHDDEREGR